MANSFVDFRVDEKNCRLSYLSTGGAKQNRQIVIIIKY
jgi:hypothetical protein